MGLAEGDEVHVTAAGERTVGITKSEDAEGFLAQLRALQRPGPADFRWSREEANERSGS
jgi:antitoxin MazE